MRNENRMRCVIRRHARHGPGSDRAHRRLLSSKIVKGATPKVCAGTAHGLCSTLKDQVNADLLAFLNA